MLRKSKRLLFRSDPGPAEPGDTAPEAENVDIGGGGDGDRELTPFVDTGTAAPVVVDASASVIPVEIDMSDGVVTFPDTSTAEGGGDVVVAVDVDVGEDISVQRGGFDVVGSAETVVVPSGDGDSEGNGAVIGGRRARAVSEKEDRGRRYDQAMMEYRAGGWKSVRACAQFFRVDHSTLGKMIKDPDAKFKGKGRVSQVFLPEEEDRIVGHIIWCMEHGTGLDIFQVRFLSF